MILSLLVFSLLITLFIACMMFLVAPIFIEFFIGFNPYENEPIKRIVGGFVIAWLITAFALFACMCASL